MHPFEERMSKRKNKTNEILEYLQTDSPHYSICILEWWKIHENRFPILSKIARDYLGIPATSAPSERVFSEAGNLITNKRTSLSCDSVEANMCLRSWLNNGIYESMYAWYDNLQ